MVGELDGADRIHVVAEYLERKNAALVPNIAVNDVRLYAQDALPSTSAHGLLLATMRYPSEDRAGYATNCAHAG